MNKLTVLVFTSITSIMSWANNNNAKSLDGAWYIQKDNLFYYFGTYVLSPVSTEYRLAFVSSKDIAGEQE